MDATETYCRAAATKAEDCLAAKFLQRRLTREQRSTAKRRRESTDLQWRSAKQRQFTDQQRGPPSSHVCEVRPSGEGLPKGNPNRQA